MIAGCLLGTAAPCASQDTGFARQAASGGLAEVSMGRLADSHAQRAGVKSFGRCPGSVEVRRRSAGRTARRVTRSCRLSPNANAASAQGPT